MNFIPLNKLQNIKTVKLFSNGYLSPRKILSAAKLGKWEFIPKQPTIRSAAKQTFQPWMSRVMKTLVSPWMEPLLFKPPRLLQRLLKLKFKSKPGYLEVRLLVQQAAFDLAHHRFLDNVLNLPLLLTMTMTNPTHRAFVSPLARM